MKRLFAALLMIAMVLSLAACGNTEAEITTEEPTAETPTTEEPTTEEPTTEEPTTEEPTTEEPTTEEQETGNLADWIDNAASSILGTRSENKYESVYMGFGVELDDSWYIYSEEELAAMLGISADQFSNENFANLLESSSSVVEFLASKADGTTISIARERLPYAMDDETYFDAAMLLMEDTLASAGYENIAYEKGTVTFLGEERICLNLSYSFTGIELYQILVLVQAEGYISVVTATSLDPAQCPGLLDVFYAI